MDGIGEDGFWSNLDFPRTLILLFDLKKFPAEAHQTPLETYSGDEKHHGGPKNLKDIE